MGPVEDDSDNEFVFKTAAISPKLESSSSASVQNISTQTSTSSQSSMGKSSITEISRTESQDTSSAIKTTVRLPVLDAKISELKREMDVKILALSKQRLEEFVEREKEADRLREEEFLAKIASPKNVSSKTKTLTEDVEKLSLNEIKELDRKEKMMFKEMKEKAFEVWDEMRKEYEDNLKQMHVEQSARLSQESQLQESLKASGAVFDRELFEKVVERCGKGRNTAYGREKMSRFWEVLDRKNPKEASSPKKTAEDDQLLASLLGINA
jgi:hypothetical protein